MRTIKESFPFWASAENNIALKEGSLERECKMAVRMDGLSCAAAIKERIHGEVERLLSAGLSRRPRLDVILVGENPASQIYVRGKERDCRE